MGRPKIELEGQRFGRLVVLEDTGKRYFGSVVWLCKCDCGGFKEVLVGLLLSGETRSCGCLRRESSRKNKKDLTGQRFGKLVVIEDTDKRKGDVIWLCRCDCGNFTKVKTGDLKSGGTQSCGCLRPWNKNLTKETDPRVANQAKQMKGDKNPAKRPEVRKKIGKANLGKPDPRKDKSWEEYYGEERAKEIKQKNRDGHIGNHHTKEAKRKNQKASIQLWQDPEWAKMMVEAQHRKPNKLEKRFNNFLQEIIPKEYQINVKAEVMTLGGKCPDFVNINGQKKIIEMNGDWRHGEKLTGRTKMEEEQQRIDCFTKEGYQTLIVWEHELEDIGKLKKKILEFNERN